jgi:hypothetical protein
MAKYVAGFNMPGYLPDSDPAEFNSYNDARFYLRSLMAETLDQEEEGNKELEIDTRKANRRLSRSNSRTLWGETD